MALRRESPLLLQSAAALLLLLVAILHTAPSVSALSCPSKCDPSWCIVVNVSECQYGSVPDICGCCYECAKGPGEKCGGTWGIYGLCSNDSVCLVTVKYGLPYTDYLETIGYCRLINSQSPSPTPSPSPSPTPSPSPSTPSSSPSPALSSSPSPTSSPSPSPALSSSPSPTSSPSPSPLSSPSPSLLPSPSLSFPPLSPPSLSPTPSLLTTNKSSIDLIPIPTSKVRLKVCRTPCSIEFCADGNNKYCSANQTGYETVPERVPCQHTTCKACRLLVAPLCPTCPEPVTKRCLRHFFLCINEHYKRDDIALELSDPRALTNFGRIVCHIPLIPNTSDDES